MGLLDEKVAIVTGGARGIGRAYCHGLAREGAAVVVADLREPTETVAGIEAERRECLRRGGRCRRPRLHGGDGCGGGGSVRSVSTCS